MPKRKAEAVQEVVGTVQTPPEEKPQRALTKRVVNAPTRPLNDSEWSVQQVLQQRKKVMELMTSAMKENVHFGKIPGADKPTLLQPGAQMLASTFRLGDRELEFVDRELPNNHREFMFRKEFYSISSGQVLTEARGMCSTMESNYRYTPVKKGEEVGPVPKAYWDAPKEPAEIRRNILIETYGPEGKLGPKKTETGWVIMRFIGTGDREENPDIANEYNTVLSMADKRCYVRGVIKALGVGDLFTHDLEDTTELEPTGDGAKKQDQKDQEKKPEPEKKPTQEKKPDPEKKPPAATTAAKATEGAAGIPGPKSSSPGPAAAGAKKEGVATQGSAEALQQQIQGMEASAEVKRLVTLCATGLTLMKTQKFLVEQGPDGIGAWTAKINAAFQKQDIAELKKLYASLQQLYRMMSAKPPAGHACKGGCGRLLITAGVEYCPECAKKLEIV
jgi:hypothetical protein